MAIICWRISALVITGASDAKPKYHKKGSGMITSKTTYSSRPRQQPISVKVLSLRALFVRVLSSKIGEQMLSQVAEAKQLRPCRTALYQ